MFERRKKFIEFTSSNGRTYYVRKSRIDFMTWKDDMVEIHIGMKSTTFTSNIENAKRLYKSLREELSA